MRVKLIFFLIYFAFFYGSVRALPLETEKSVNSSTEPDSQKIPSVEEALLREIDEDIGLENILLFEGDIITDEQDDKNLSTIANKLWPRGIIPYIISSNLSEHESEIINATKYIENATCLRFVPRFAEKNYITIYKGNGCFSKVGMADGSQNVSLGSGCYQLGKIMHELLHVVGFYHEHSRPDRDDFIDVDWKNIRHGHKQNFKKRKLEEDPLITPYDYQSIMHYNSYTFSKDKSRGLKTLIPKQKGVILKSPGEKVLSETDIKRISLLYNCTTLLSTIP